MYYLFLLSKYVASFASPNSLWLITYTPYSAHELKYQIPCVVVFCISKSWIKNRREVDWCSDDINKRRRRNYHLYRWIKIGSFTLQLLCSVLFSDFNPEYNYFIYSPCNCIAYKEWDSPFSYYNNVDLVDDCILC